MLIYAGQTLENGENKIRKVTSKKSLFVRYLTYNLEIKMLNPIPSYLPTNKLLGRVGLSINYVMKHLTNIYLVYLIYELTLVNF